MSGPLQLTDELAELIFSEMVDRQLPLALAVAALREDGRCSVSVSAVEGWRSKGRDPDAPEVYRRFREAHDDARTAALFKVYKQLEALNRKNPMAARELRAIKSTMFSELNERHVSKVEHSGGVRFERLVQHPEARLVDGETEGDPG